MPICIELFDSVIASLVQTTLLLNVLYAPFLSPLSPLIILGASYCVSVVSSTRTLTPRPHRAKPSHLCVCISYTLVFPTSETAVSLHWITERMEEAPFTLQLFSAPSLFILLFALYCVPTFSSTRTLQPWPHQLKPFHFFVCHSSTTVCIELYENIMSLQGLCTHLPFTVQIFSIFHSVPRL